MVKETEDPTGTETAHETTHDHAHERPASAGARRISVTGARMLREALRHGGDALSAALREAGDVVMAVDAGALDPADLVPLAGLVRGEAFALPDRPRIFKSVGMAWEDAALAAALLDRL